MANSADPDQLASEPTDLDLHCLQSRVYPGSAGQGYNKLKENYKDTNFFTKYVWLGTIMVRSGR